MHRLFMSVSVVLLMVLGLTALAVEEEIPPPGWECDTFTNHSGFVPGSYDAGIFVEAGFDTEIHFTNGENINIAPPPGRSSWDTVHKCDVPDTTTTTTVPETSTTTTVESTTTTGETSSTSSTTTTIPSSTTTQPSTTTTQTSTTTTESTTTTSTSVSTTSSTVPPTTTTSVVPPTTESPKVLPRTGGPSLLPAALALLLLTIGSVSILWSRFRAE